MYIYSIQFPMLTSKPNSFAWNRFVPWIFLC